MFKRWWKRIKSFFVGARRTTGSAETIPVGSTPTPDVGAGLPKAPGYLEQGAFGIDVSHHNGKLDWKKIKESGVKFAYLKCTEGLSFFDSRFIENVKGAKANGILVGAYHFFRPDKDPIAQANFFYRSFKDLGLELLPVCDWEAHKGQGEAAQVKNVKLFLDALEFLTKQKPMIYTGKWYVDEVDAKDPKTPLPQWLANYPLWLSDYSPTSVALPKPWSKYDLLQYTETGRLSKHPGLFDLNRVL